MINYAGDWDFQDSSIKCFEDHEQASVFNVQLTSDSIPVRVLTFSYERALDIVAEAFSVPLQPRPHNRELHQETGTTLMKELNELEREILHCKFVAAYLASCHAATLESLPKRTPKRDRERFVSICDKAAKALRGTWTPPCYGQPIIDTIESDIIRCERSVKRYQGSEALK